MRRRILSQAAIRNAAIALVLVISLVSIGTSPVAAEEGDYFEIIYDFGLSQTEIQGSEVFYATVTGEGTCLETLPVSVSEAKTSFRFVAEPQAAGDSATLNSSYTVTIKPFPYKKGDTFQMDADIPLQFPDGSEPGDYDVVAELVEAKIYGPLFPDGFDVTDLFPPSYALGSVTYTTPPNNPPNQPGNPSPANHATDVPVNADLGWTGGDPDAGNTVTYDVYFGASSPPPFKETIGPYPAAQSPITCDPGALSYNTKYYWYVVATDNLSASTPAPLPGDVWDFTTAGEWAPWAYDGNSDGVIQKTEAIQAIMDYFSQEITKAQAIEVIMLYFG